MAILTEFGKFVRKMRIDKDISLKKMAVDADVTPAFISAMETGRKAISPNILNKIARSLKLTDEESRLMNFYAAQQIKELRIPLSHNSNAERLLAYARKLDDAQGNPSIDLDDFFEGEEV